MPRFYFHIEDAPDQEGTELPDIERARQEAICIAGELLRDGIGKVIWDEKPWRMWVTDQPGGGSKPLFTFRFSASES